LAALNNCVCWRIAGSKNELYSRPFLAQSVKLIYPKAGARIYHRAT